MNEVRKRRSRKTVDEWYDLMVAAWPAALRRTDATSHFEGPLHPMFDEVIRELDLDTNSTSLVDRYVAVGWVDDLGRIPGEGSVSTGTYNVHRYFLRRGEITRELAATACAKVQMSNRRHTQELRRRRDAERAAGPAPAVTRRVDEGDLVPGKKVVVESPTRRPAPPRDAPVSAAAQLPVPPEREPTAAEWKQRYVESHARVTHLMKQLDAARGRHETAMREVTNLRSQVKRLDNILAGYRDRPAGGEDVEELKRALAEQQRVIDLALDPAQRDAVDLILRWARR